MRACASIGGAVAVAAMAALPAVPAAAAGDATYIVVSDANNASPSDIESHGHHVVGGAAGAGVLIVRSSDPGALAGLSGVNAVVADSMRYSVPKAEEIETVDVQGGGGVAACASTTQSCPYQWDLARIHVPAAWTVTRGDASVRVAVLDTGMTSSHVNVPLHYDVAHSKSEVQPSSFCPADTATFASLEDFNGHGTWTGTHVAGQSNSLMTGIAPDVTYLNFRVLGACGFGLDSWVMQGMLDASNAGAQIESMSLGGFMCGAGVVPGSAYCGSADSVGQDPVLWRAYQKLVRYLDSRGTVVVAAAGNDGAQIDSRGMVASHGTLADCATAVNPCNDYYGLTESPGGVPGVVAVAALNRVTANAPGAKQGQYGVGLRDQLSYYSNYGPRVDVSAPGGARNDNVPRFDCASPECSRLKASPGKTDNPGDFGALGACGPVCYGNIQGTSMATPQVAGVAALALAARPQLSTGALRQLITHSVTSWSAANATPGIEDDSSSPLFGWDKDYDGAPISNAEMGSGVIDAARAVTGGTGN